VLFAVFGSGVELETWAVFVTQALPLLGAVVVIVNDAVPLGAQQLATRARGAGRLF
jgi:hypothetical protein